MLSIIQKILNIFKITLVQNTLKIYKLDYLNNDLKSYYLDEKRLDKDNPLHLKQLKILLITILL